jgi:hypothetical protein
MVPGSDESLFIFLHLRAYIRRSAQNCELDSQALKPCLVILGWLEL